jgi:hypothetical protein
MDDSVVSELEASLLNQLAAAAADHHQPAAASAAAARRPSEELVLNAAAFVNPAQLVNHRHKDEPSSSSSMDPTIGHRHELPDLSSSGNQLMERGVRGGASSPLGSPSAGLMCSSLGEEDAALFSLPLPLSSDMHT